jgi:hypothetical protein
MYDELVLRVASRYLKALSPHQRGWEHRREKDDFTEQNIPPEHLVLWRKLKPQFKGTPDQRAEQFMEYLEEHPGESDAAIQQDSDKEIAKLVKQEGDCSNAQTKYEDALQKEQERATREQGKLQVLREKADSYCRNCPTCNYQGEAESAVPF